MATMIAQSPTVQGSASTAVLADCAPMSPDKTTEIGNSQASSDQPATDQPPVPQSEQAIPREIGGRAGLEPTRYGDWEKAGRCIDF
jgi:hypothetical protein